MGKKKIWTIIAIIAAIVMIGVIAHENHSAIQHFFGENQEVVQDTASSTIVEDIEFSIHDYVELRKQMKEDRRIDSVFLNIPDVIFVNILQNHGTDVSISDIVYIYESNKSVYDKVLSGAESQKYLDDSIPKNTTTKDIEMKEL